MKRKKGGKGFTLIEIIIVLAVLAILAAVVVPNVTGYLARGKERAWNADRDILQAAVDAYRTDISQRVGNPWPTIGGVIGTPTDANADGDFADDGDTNSFIDIGALATDNYIKGADVVKSANTTYNTTATNSPSGSYAWFIDSNGVVQSWYDSDGDGVIDNGETGFQSGIYP